MESEMNKPEQIVSKVERGEWFTNVGKPDGIVYRAVKTGENTAKYEVVARGCSVEVAEQIVTLPALRAACQLIDQAETRGEYADRSGDTAAMHESSDMMRKAITAIRRALAQGVA
jgi:hypothetical protein